MQPLQLKYHIALVFRLGSKDFDNRSAMLLPRSYYKASSFVSTHMKV